MGNVINVQMDEDFYNKVIANSGGSGSDGSGSGNGDCIDTNAYLIINSYFQDTDGNYKRYEAHINIENKEVKYFKPYEINDTMYVSYTQIDKETYLAFTPNFVNSYLSNITDTDIVLKAVKEYPIEINFGKLYINEINENPYIEYVNIEPHSGSFGGDIVEIINNTPILRYDRNAQISITDDIINKRFASIKYSNGKVINLYAEL